MTVILLFSLLIFLMGLLGLFLFSKHIFLLLICIELLLMSMNLNFVGFAMFLDDMVGQLMILLILTVAASETAIGLAILVIFYSLRGGILTELLTLLKSSLLGFVMYCFWAFIKCRPFFSYLSVKMKLVIFAFSMMFYWVTLDYYLFYFMLLVVMVFCKSILMLCDKLIYFLFSVFVEKYYELLS